MTHYFIDFENVHSEGLKGISEIEQGAVIYLLYTETCKNISLDILESADTRGIKIHPLKVAVGSKNALDFQLSSLLGYFIGTNKPNEEDKFVIISNDTGYDVVIKFWEKRKVKILKSSNFSESKKMPIDKKQKTVKGIKQTTEQELLSYLPKDGFFDDILNIINSYKTKQAINNGISKLCKDSKMSGTIYKKLKPLFSEKDKT